MSDELLDVSQDLFPPGSGSVRASNPDAQHSQRGFFGEDESFVKARHDVVMGGRGAMGLRADDKDVSFFKVEFTTDSQGGVF